MVYLIELINDMSCPFVTMQREDYFMTTSKLRTVELTYCATFVSLIAICSWISVPTTIPFTMQTFAVFFTLFMLGGLLGTYAVAVYLLVGAVGVPVFAGFSGGMGILLGTTGGYLLGFLAISILYLVLIKNPMEKPWLDIIVLIIGQLVCYVLGTLQFVFVYGQNVGEIGVMTALGWCVLPYIIPDLIKLTLAFTLAKRLRAYVRL